MPGQKDETYPKIRKVIFIIDKDRKYSFDVDQNIAIYNLKMMIISAASLGKVSLRIFHEGKEYTQNDPDLLDFLFPTLDTVIFTLSIDENTVNKNNALTKINLLSKKYCSKHMNKYPYFFFFFLIRAFVQIAFYQKSISLIRESHKLQSLSLCFLVFEIQHF